MIETVWVSFADPDKFRGVAIVDVDLDENVSEMDSTLLIIQKTIELGCNGGPNTSVQMFRLKRYIDCEHKNKLILDEVLLDRINKELEQKCRPN